MLGEERKAGEHEAGVDKIHGDCFRQAHADGKTGAHVIDACVPIGKAACGDGEVEFVALDGGEAEWIGGVADAPRRLVCVHESPEDVMWW